MKNTFLALMLALSSFMFAQLKLVAIVHPGCSHCQAWEADWEKQQSAVKEKLTLRLVDVTNFDDVQWVESVFPDTLGSTPTFLIVKDENGKQVVLDHFSGYPNWPSFEKKVTKVLEANS